MGLLSRASTLETTDIKPGLAFSDFINKHSIKTCALLEKHEADYIVTNSIGFDVHSIVSAVSTVDFWNGICKSDNKIFSFSGLQKSALLQLFSSSLKENLDVISTYRNSKGNILLCEGNITVEAAKDFELISNIDHQNDIQQINAQIKDGSVVLLFKINFSDAVKACYEKEFNNSNLEYSNFERAVFNEIYNRFCCNYNISDATIKNGINKLKTVFVTDKAYSVNLITHHIVLNLKETLEAYTDMIQIDFAGTADSCEKIQLFLQAE